jgi:hypothetical protein
MNGLILKAMLGHYAANPPKPEEVDQLYTKYEPQLLSVPMDQLEGLKPAYPTLVPAIDQIKGRIAKALVLQKS